MCLMNCPFGDDKTKFKWPILTAYKMIVKILYVTYYGVYLFHHKAMYDLYKVFINSYKVLLHMHEKSKLLTY